MACNVVLVTLSSLTNFQTLGGIAVGNTGTVEEQLITLI
ncbi:hypothetical protein GLYMA_17G142120v4 [Glycine max]|nr:hypothetical protein GLYMA_17G142120v4 [Glycine max]